MLRKITTACFCVLLCACNVSESPQENWNTRSVKMEKVKGLEDCTMHFIKRFDSASSEMKVIRCPGAINVTSNYSEGKTTEDVNIIIDTNGKEIGKKMGNTIFLNSN